MKFSARKRLIPFAVACMLLVSGCTAYADPALVTSDAVVYASADTSSKRLGKLSSGAQLELVAKKGGWAMVTLNGHTGYMNAGALTEIVSYKDKAAYTSKDAPMYKSYSTSSKKLGTIPSGSKVSVSAIAGDWARVTYQKYTGFVKVSALTTSAPSAPETPTQSIKAYASVDKAKVYNIKGKVIGTVPLNTEVTIRETRNGICQVERSGHIAYMMQNELSTNKTEVKPDNGVTEISPTTFYVKNDGAKVYNSKGKVIGSLALNADVSVSAYTDTLAKISKGGNVGFMYRSDLSSSKIETQEPDNGVTEISPTTFYVKNDGAKVYNSKGKIIGSLALNADVSVSAYTDTLAKISKGGNVGFMYRSDLSSSKVETQEPDNGVTEISPTTFYVKNDGAKVYNSKGKVIGSLALNADVSVSAYTDTLARISKGGNVGFMYRSDLSSSKIETQEPDNGVTEISPTTFYVKNDGAKVLDGNGKTLSTLTVNTAVTVTAYNDTIAKVTNGSTVGFMQRSDLSSSKVETGSSNVLQYGDKGEAVSKVQTRLKELGYFAGSVGGNYLDLTKAAVSAFQAAAGITTTGVCDEKTLSAMFADNAPKREVPSGSGDVTPGNSTVKAATGTAKAMDWWNSGIQSIFARGTTATITDVATGIAWREKRTGGTNHADVQPVTAADTAAMKKAAGSWSWTRRAIFVTIDGVNYAASMNCMPHGNGSIKDNNFNGHHCIHFTNSRTHGSNKVCSLHQAAIKKAANTTL